MRLFAGGTTTPLVVKQLGVKIENLRDFDHDFALFRAKIWLWLFYNFIWVMVLKKFQIISSKIEGVTAIFAILDLCDFFYQSLDIVTPHVIPFCNPWDNGIEIGWLSRFL